VPCALETFRPWFALGVSHGAQVAAERPQSLPANAGEVVGQLDELAVAARPVLRAPPTSMTTPVPEAGWPSARWLTMPSMSASGPAMVMACS
jgi:hypothetical protein